MTSFMNFLRWVFIVPLSFFGAIVIGFTVTFFNAIMIGRYEDPKSMLNAILLLTLGNFIFGVFFVLGFYVIAPNSKVFASLFGGIFGIVCCLFNLYMYYHYQDAYFEGVYKLICNLVGMLMMISYIKYQEIQLKQGKISSIWSFN